MSWQPFTAENVVFDLAHLAPFTLDVTPKAEGAPTFRVLVSFGHHTFTREFKVNDPPHMSFVHGTDQRCFCPDRHGHSLALPNVVRGHATGRAYFSQSRNYLLVEDLPGVVGPYAVFFNMEKSKARSVDANMFVVSAYPKPALPAKRELPTITFATLVAKTAAGEPVYRPKK